MINHDVSYYSKTEDGAGGHSEFIERDSLSEMRGVITSYASQKNALEVHQLLKKYFEIMGAALGSMAISSSNLAVGLGVVNDALIHSWKGKEGADRIASAQLVRLMPGRNGILTWAAQIGGDGAYICDQQTGKVSVIKPPSMNGFMDLQSLGLENKYIAVGSYGPFTLKERQRLILTSGVLDFADEADLYRYGTILARNYSPERTVNELFAIDSSEDPKAAMIFDYDRQPGIMNRTIHLLP